MLQPAARRLAFAGMASACLLASLASTGSAAWPNPLLPPWPPTFNMSLSTIAQPCNYSGMLEPTFASQFGLLDLDWSNAKLIWANSHPMNSEELMVQQAQELKKRNPASHQWVYRNLVKALPWMKTVRDKLQDPAYAGFFLRFRPDTGAALCNGTTPCVTTRCDTNYNPPRCSPLYHDQDQSPQHPAPHDKRMGFCTDACDCGTGVPCGEYLWDHRNGSMLREFLMEEYIGGPTGVDHPAIDGIFFDDGWQGPRGPTEIGHGPQGGARALVDMGLSAADAAEITEAWSATMLAAHHRVLKSHAFDWQLLNCPHYPTKMNSGCGGASTQAPDRDTTNPQPGCTSFMRKYCGASSPFQNMALMFGFTRATQYDPLFTTNLSLPFFKQDLATFLAVRGPYAWLGYGFQGCAGHTQPHDAFPGPTWREAGYVFPPELSVDYGEPEDGSFCHETANGSEIFTREYTKATVTMDCAKFEGTITMKAGRVDE